MTAQEYLEKNFADKQTTIISFSEEEKLTGDLIIQDYPNLEEIYLPNHELTSLTVINCPNLKKINVRNNLVSKLEIQGTNQIAELIAGQNQLESLNLANCPKISRLIVPDNPLLSKLENLNLVTIKDINVANTLVNLAEENEKLKAENKNLYEIIKTVDEGGYQKKLVIVEPIQTTKQAEEAIQRHLSETAEK